MKLAVQFGAGKIGRGFMGQLFFEAGYHTLFVEADPELARLLDERRSYRLRLLDAYARKEREITVTEVSALRSSQTARFASAFARAAVAATAVGVENLPAVAPLIAAGVRARAAYGRGPIDLFLCENGYRASRLLRRSVFDLLDADLLRWATDNVGFVGMSVARVVPARHESDPLLVCADSHRKLAYDGPAARAIPPPIEGMYPVSNFRAEVERKLYTHNLGQAALGYVGYLKGYTYVHEALADPYLADIFNGALEETTRALLAKYPIDLLPAQHREVLADVRVRFANPLLMDSVFRVARDPIRKLAPGDRLIGSARLCLAQGVVPENVALVCGAALNYDWPEDPAAVRLSEMISTEGVGAALEQLAGLEPESELGVAIVSAYHHLRDLRALWGRR